MAGSTNTMKTLLMCACAALAAAACAPRDPDQNADVSPMGGDTSSMAMTAESMTPPTPGPQMQPVLTELAELGPKPIPSLTPAEARQQPTPADAVEALLRERGESTAPPPGVSTVDRTIPGPAGALPVRVYTPQGSGPFPVIVYYHGGGWVIGNYEVYDAGARAMSRLANAVVISVDYRLGPENKFPAAHDDAFGAYRWALENAASIQGDPARVAVAGESAGGNLAVATAIAARDQNVRLPVHVLSVYPIAGTDTTTQSYQRNADAKPLNRPMMVWFFDHYTNGPSDWQDPRINLLGANLQGLPPTTIITAEIDPLRTEGRQLAEQLEAAGVNVQARDYTEVTHEFFGMAAVLDKAEEAQQFAANRLKESFSR